MLLLFLVLIIIFFVLQRRWLTKKQRAFEKKLKSNVRVLPIIGHSYMFIGNTEDRMKAIQDLGKDAIECGGISKMLHMNELLVCVADPVAAEVLLRECLDKHDLMKLIKHVSGNSSIIASVPIWRHRRRMNTPLFSTQKIKQYLKCFTEHSDAMVDQLEKEVNKGTFSLLKYIEVSSMNAVCDTPSSFVDHQLKVDETRRYSEQELIEETIMLVIAGFDTSANVSSFVCTLLSRHQDIQDKVYKELRDVFGDSDRAATYEDLSQLSYLNAVIKETLRLYPLAPVIVRRTDKDVTLPSGLTIVKGCGVLVNLWALHRNPVYWGSDAEQFRPERFFDAPPTHPAAYMPFSSGLRGCLGNRYAMIFLKCVLSTLLRRYRVVAPPNVTTDEPLKTKFEILMKHVDNYDIQLEHRK